MVASYHHGRRRFGAADTTRFARGGQQRAKSTNAVSTVVLGFVKAAVGVRQDVGDTFARAGLVDASRDGDVKAHNLTKRGHFGAHLLRTDQRASVGRLGEYDQKLLAPPARDQIRLA